MAAALLFLCLSGARAESDSEYGFDGEGTYCLFSEQVGGRLAWREGAASVTLDFSSDGTSPMCGRFVLRSCGGNRYVIFPEFAADSMLCSYEYGNGLQLRIYPGTVPAEAQWRVEPQQGAVRIVNVMTGRFLSAFGAEVSLKPREDTREGSGRESTLWVPIKASCYGTSKDSPVRELQVEESEVERRITMSAKVPLCELFGFAWGPLARPEDFVISVDKPELLKVTADGRVFLAERGEGTVSLRHRYTGTRLRVSLSVCNNAVVIVPGFMGSELENGKGEKIWSESLLSELTDGVSFSAISRFTSLASPSRSDGVRAVNNYFGALDLYKDLYRRLTVTLKKDAAVELFAYDWRRSCAETGAELAAYLERQNYDGVVLIGHSFGGLVCMQALASSDTLREHTLLACMVGVPVNGAAGIPEAWAEDRFGNALGLGSFGSVENNMIRRIIGTLPSLYEMLPSEYAVETLGVIDGCSSYGDFLDACAEQCGSFDKGLARTAAATMRRVYSDGVCVLDRVPTALYGGHGIDTVSETGQEGDSFSFTRAYEGDGIVSLAECVAGTAHQKDDVVSVFERHLWLASDAELIELLTERITPIVTEQSQE